jgi:hypothetical protein
MFDGCTNLNYIKCLATGTYYKDIGYWVSGVQTTSGTFVKNPSTSWNVASSSNNYQGYPANWTVQDAS